MKLFFDTNIFLRLFEQKDNDLFLQAKRLLIFVEEGKLQPATSTIVLMEIMHTLRSFYRQNHSSIERHITSILSIKNLFLIEKTDFRKAFILYQQVNEKIADCLIVTQIPEAYKLCSFNERLGKVIGKNRFVHPSKVTG